MSKKIANSKDEGVWVDLFGGRWHVCSITHDNSNIIFSLRNLLTGSLASCGLVEFYRLGFVPENGWEVEVDEEHYSARCIK